MATVAVGAMAMSERLSADWLNAKRRRTWPRERASTHGLPLPLRVHRAIRWIERGEMAEDLDIRFICYWIAFNAAYGVDADDTSYKTAELTAISEFLRHIVTNDADGDMKEVFLDFRLKNAVQILVGNRYVYEPFWKYRHGVKGFSGWEARFKAHKDAFDESLRRQDTLRVLRAVFYSIYTLRNQLMHGGATWNSSVNREQVRDGADIMGAIVPRCVNIMMDSQDDAFWGRAYYPPVD